MFSKPISHPSQSSGQERFFDPNSFIVSKTDEKGIIRYANDIFLDIADYTEEEVIGKPHSLIRHPDMPKSIFKLMWERLKGGNEIFAYVKNRTKFGDYYWVFAHVTPSLDSSGVIVGYHSNRRVPNKQALDVIIPLYQSLLVEERKHSTPQQGMQAAYDMLMNVISEKGVSYDEFILSL